MPNLNGNYVDLIIILVLIYFASEAWTHGVWVLMADFISFLGSLLISLRAYKFASSFISSNFSISHSIANALGFLVTAVVSEAILGTILGHIISLLPEKIWKGKWSKILALVPATGEGIVLVAFVLTLILGLPVKPSIKQDISDSKIGGYILQKTSGIEKTINEIFGGAIEDSLTYFTVEPGSKTTIPLNVRQLNLTVDTQSETQMFQLVNKERRDRGIPELTWAPNIVPLARAHAMDMWQRNYFGHISPEGKDVGNRLQDAGISYEIAGENLALAPTLASAHTGLMNSEGHRENILDTRFHKVGIGVIDNGYYGKMFVQVFTD